MLVEQKVEELASFSLETNRIPDPYYFEVDNEGDLFSPTAKSKIKDVIRRDSYIGRVEGQALDFINQRVRENKDNPDYQEVFAWASGPYEGVYDDLKVVISEIQGKGRERKLFNTAIIFDFNPSQSLDFVQRLAQHSQHSLITNLEEARIKPLILDTSDAHWTDILQDIVGRPKLWEFIRREDDKRAKQEALRKANKLYEKFFRGSNRFIGWVGDRFNDLLRKSDLLGPNKPHCLLGTALEVVLSNSIVVSSKDTDDSLPAWRRDKKHPDYCIHCGACGVEINQVVLKGEKCPAKPRSCGAARVC